MASRGCAGWACATGAGCWGWGPKAIQPTNATAATLAAAADAAYQRRDSGVRSARGANDYLLAHQGFSPRIYLQGMAPYVRTVSEQAVEPRK